MYTLHEFSQVRVDDYNYTIRNTHFCEREKILVFYMIAYTSLIPIPIIPTHSAHRPA